MPSHPIRRTRLLDGHAWQIRPHLGLSAALEAAARVGAPAEASIHAVHSAADAAAGWLPARVPGSVVDDLHRAGEIADPYVERNSRLAEWVPQRAWTYRRALDPPSLAPGERAWLRFEGIDHAGHVFLDGRRVADHEGTFVPLEVEVTGLLREVAGDRGRGKEPGMGGGHELAVVVEPAPDSEPQVGRTSLVRVHKPRMSYGWDFCPRLVHQGLWQSVAWITAGPVRIRDVWARPELDSDLRRAQVRVRVELDVADGWDDPVAVEASLGGRTARVETRGGDTTAELELEVAAPALWWPNGLGDQALHELVVRASIGGDVVDEHSVSVGVRRIEREAAPDAPSSARPWIFAVNGRRFEIKGWNWTPLDTLFGVPRPGRLEHLLRLAARSGANLLRVWGGGLIETEAFYTACDRLGLLVWQEFSQSSSGIDNAPAADDAFVERMRREAEAIVPLRRNHPSLAIWCGGNELQAADGRPLDDADSPVLAALHEVVGRLDPDRIWLPTSPSGPRFHNRLSDIEAAPDELHDVHGPWEHQGLAPQHELWDRGTSLFSGEFGVEGMTNRRTHERLIRPEHRWPADRSNAVYRHLGDWWNNAPLVQAAFGGRLRDVESLRRASQWLQADGLRTAIEANRRRWPRNGGSIVWQLNESYPNAWCTAVVDHGGEPKPAFHAVRRAWAPTLISARFATPALDGGPLSATIFAWSRDGSLDQGTVGLRVVDLGGAVHHETRCAVDLRDGATASLETGSIPLAECFGPLVFLDLTLERADGTEATAGRYLFARDADLGAVLDLAPATVDVTAERSGDAWRVSIAHRSGPAAVGLVVHDGRAADDAGWPELDDNGFDLLPGESRSIEVGWAGAAKAGRRLVATAWNVAEVVVE